MKIKKYVLKKIIVLMVLTMIMLNGMLFEFPSTSNAANANSTAIEKISNKDSGEREADGIVPGGDRETSYAWAMATRGNYIYVGTNKNVIGSVAESIVDTLVQAGDGNVTEDMAWGIVNMATNNDIPRPTTTVGGEIFKCNIQTGEVTKIFTVAKGVAFRMAIEHDGMLYFASYSGDITAENYIYKIDANDEVTEAFVSTGGSSMRAACEYDNSLLFGGVDARTEFEQGDEDCVGLAIIKKDENDDTKWDRIADYKDFKQYASDSAVKNSAISPIWDICTYKGYVYATIPNSLGTVMYKGHPAEDGEIANEYGWYWTEVIGKNSEVNNIGLADTAEGQIGDNAGLITMAATPFVYKDSLYLMNFDNTIQAEVKGIQGLLLALSGSATDMSEYLKPMYTTLKNPQKLWRYDDTTEKFNEVENLQQYMKDTCNEYLWRTEIYNDELYITTMDSAVMYDWVAQLTGRNFTSLTDEEIDSVTTTIDNTISQLQPLASNAQIAEIIQTLEETKVMIDEFKTVMDDGVKFNDFVVKYENLIGRIEILTETVTNMGSNSITADLVEFCTKVDWDGLRMYAYIVRLLKNNTWGFDMLKTSDGENFEVVTDSGFNDKYNYGGRSLVATDAGLYIGTANPFYGAQLWRLSAKSETTTDPSDPADPTDPSDPADPTDPTNPTDPSNPTDPTDPSESTGITKEEYEELKNKLDEVVQNQEKFEEEINKLNEKINGYEETFNKISESGKLAISTLDNTIAKEYLPKAGMTSIFIALVIMIVVFVIIVIKNKQYKDI